MWKFANSNPWTFFIAANITIGAAAMLISSRAPETKAPKIIVGVPIPSQRDELLSL